MQKKQIIAIIAFLIISISVVVPVVLVKGKTKPVEVTTTTETTTEKLPTIHLSDVYEEYYDGKTFSEFYAGQVIGHIYSEYLSIDCDLVYGTSDACLSMGAGLHKCSTLPGMKTPQDINSTCPIIAGHVQIDFKGLSVIDPATTELPEGVTITIQMPYGDYVYEVKRLEIIKNTDFQFRDYRASYGNFTEDTAIFYTCYPFGRVDYVKKDRLFLFCELVSGTELVDNTQIEETT